LLGSWKVVEGTKWIRKPELNPEINPEMFAYLLKPVNTFDHSKKSCGSGTMTGRKKPAKRFENSVSDPSTRLRK
jgi:hypothetical protein